tara:strand:- start:876 stop:1253 length:378 start_codon:yes stop_codon:yes gene_type:complete
MTIWKGKSNKKPSGGKYSFFRSKKKYELGPDAKPTVIGKKDTKKVIRKRGGETRVKLVKAQFANISDNKKTKKVKILNVVENAANRHFARRNVLTKGAHIKTDAGEAIVTSRPSQDGVVNAKLIK